MSEPLDPTKSFQQQTWELAGRLDELPKLVFTEFLQVVLEEHERRAVEEDDPRNPWDEARHLIAERRLRFQWSTLSDGLGRITTRDGGRTHTIHLHAPMTDRPRGWRKANEVLAHELEHRRRDLLFSPGTDTAFVAEAEIIVDAYALHRLGRCVGQDSPVLDL